MAKRPEGSIKMKVSHALLDDRINDNTTVVIKDMFGDLITCGRWYQDKILVWCNFEATLEFVEGRNIAILQLQVT